MTWLFNLISKSSTVDNLQITIDLVLSEFKDMLFFLHHFLQHYAEDLSVHLGICFPVLYKLESSAYRSIVESATVILW